MKPALSLLVTLILAGTSSGQNNEWPQHGNTPEARNGAPAPAGKCFDCFGRLRHAGGIPDVCCKHDPRNQSGVQQAIEIPPSDEQQLRAENAAYKQGMEQLREENRMLRRLLAKAEAMIDRMIKDMSTEKWPPRPRSPLAPIREAKQ